MGFSATDIPDQTGRTVVVTGANSGLGLETSRELARKGAHVVMGCRSAEKAEAAVADLRSDVPGARLTVLPLDLADLASVRAFAESVRGAFPRVDVLVNNAGVMAIPYRKTADGFEMQLGTNHLGHFALTLDLLEHLVASAPARVVTVSSTFHWTSPGLWWSDMHGERLYFKWAAYGASKLANLLFTRELARRLDEAGVDVTAVTVHPGYTATHLQLAGPELAGSRLGRGFWSVVNAAIGQTPAQGALPSLYAATMPDVRPGEYIGSGGTIGVWGAPRRAIPSPAARSDAAARRLWAWSEGQTGQPWPLAEAAPRG